MTEEDDKQNAERFERYARRQEMYENLEGSIGTFLAQYAVFESIFLTAALKAVSDDPTVIEYLPELMPLEQRLKLLRYLCVARKVPQQLMSDVRAVYKAADRLREHRNEVAHGAAVLSGPGTALTDMDPADLVAGVRRPHSKRQTVVSSTTDPTTLHLASLHTRPTIEAWAAESLVLQHATRQLAEKLSCYKRDEPWEQLKVTEVRDSRKVLAEIAKAATPSPDKSQEG